MKDKKEIKNLLKKLGKGSREIYLELNPNGYSSVNKVHKSKKIYNRKNNKQWQLL